MKILWLFIRFALLILAAFTAGAFAGCWSALSETTKRGAMTVYDELIEAGRQDRTPNTRIVSKLLWSNPQDSEFEKDNRAISLQSAERLFGKVKSYELEEVWHAELPVPRLARLRVVRERAITNEVLIGAGMFGFDKVSAEKSSNPWRQ